MSNFFKTKKMKTVKLFFICIIVCSASIMYVGCKKETNPVPNPTIPISPMNQAGKVALENASIQGAFADAFQQVDLVIHQNGLRSTHSSVIITITPNDLTTYPKDVVIDFGTSNTGSDGVVRSGQILAHLTAPYIDSGSVTTISFNDYHVNNRLITGTETINNAGKNSVGHYVFDVIILNGNLYSPDGVTVYNSHQQREWIVGDNTLLDLMDDVYLVTGTGSGNTTANVNYTLNITEALQVAIACAWVESGKVDITEPNIPVITLDYGNGNCDDQAIATCGGYTYAITMQ